jgi:hypothetical protein
MTFIHGKNTVVKVATKDLSAYTDSSELEIGADTHDTTTYGNNSHRKSGGLLDGSFKMSGTYDSTAVTGPRAALKPLIGTTVAVIRQPEGAGSTKPQDSFNAVVGKYVETSPVADMVKWSCEFEIDGDVNSAAQV